MKPSKHPLILSLNFLFSLTLFLSNLSSVFSESSCLLSNSEPATTCQQCLGLHPNCVWCPHRVSFADPALGCIPQNSSCPLDPIRPRPKLLLLRDKPLSQTRGKHVQLRPQLVQLVGSPGSNLKLRMLAALADVAVDLYFVMDLSNSMQVHQTNLVQAAEAIAQSVTRLTSDCRFGFGSFSDKPLAPFASELSFYLELIKGGKRKQPPPYSFNHQLSLTKDVSLFRQRVKSAPLAANIDSPESGLEALLQAVLCQELVGWRTGQVRKVVVFITDEDTHFALDAKLAGIVEPSDMKCHTNERDGYTVERSVDYPSLSQIRAALALANVDVVFAVDQFMHNLYSDISLFIQGSERVGHLTRDSRSLEAIIEQQYRAIKSRLKLEISPDHSKLVDISLTSDCDQPSEDNSACFNVTEAQIVNFEAEIKFKDEICAFSEEKSFSISLSGFPSDRLEIGLQCEQCECNDNDDDDLVCNNKGELVCGGCECREGYTGAQCECDIGKDEYVDNERCVDDDDNVCNDNGRCVCGKCQCRKGFIGERCQCEVDQCPKDQSGRVCGSRGTCHCQTDQNGSSWPSCDCSDGYSGEACTCALSDVSCRDVFTDQICNNRGKCVCGKCVCEDNFDGEFCQREKYRSDCQLLEPCIKLHQFVRDADQLEANAEYRDWAEACLSLGFVAASTPSISTILTQGFVKDFVHVACPTNATDVFLYDMHRSKTECQLANLDNESDSNLEDNLDALGPTRGDQRAESRLAKVFTAELERCVGTLGNCDFVFYHDHLLSDQFFRHKRLGEVFVVHRNVSGEFGPLTTCRAISLAMVLISSGGLLLFIGVALIVAIIVIINLNDLRRWQQYLAWLAENEQRLGEHQNPLYQEKPLPTSSFANPAFKKK